jgi:exodeoxyribonuclease III
MRIATWNVNSVKAHLESVTTWLREAKPDVVCLQEIKCEDNAFPAAHFEELGYRAAVHGQKTYNGVALLSKLPMEDVIDGANAVRVCGLYLPNGNPAPGPKYDYKLAWMERLKVFAKAELKKEEAFVLAGDYNVIPGPEDARSPQNWLTDALFLPQTKQAFRELEALGLTESYRALNPSKIEYSFWDYQAGAWPKNNGIRIDHLLLSPQAADKLTNVEIHKHVRGHEKPSDHVPVVIELQ